MFPSWLTSLSITPLAGIGLGIALFLMAGYNQETSCCRKDSNSNSIGSKNGGLSKKPSMVDALDLESQMVKEKLDRPCLCMMPFASALFILVPGLRTWTILEVKDTIINNPEKILNDGWKVNWPVKYLAWAVVGFDLLSFLAIAITHASGMKNRRAKRKAREKNQKLKAKMIRIQKASEERAAKNSIVKQPRESNHNRRDSTSGKKHRTTNFSTSSHGSSGAYSHNPIPPIINEPIEYQDLEEQADNNLRISRKKDKNPSVMVQLGDVQEELSDEVASESQPLADLDYSADSSEQNATSSSGSEETNSSSRFDETTLDNLSVSR